MLTYTVRLPGAPTLDGRLTGRPLEELLHALSHGSAGALRLRVEGRSTFRRDRLPAWVERGTDFTIRGFTEDGPGVVLAASALIDVLPERFEQKDMFSEVDPQQSALALLAESLGDAAAGRADSDAFDANLLRVFSQDFSRLFSRGIQSVDMTNGSARTRKLSLDAGSLREVAKLRDRTPRSRRVRLAGRLDEARLRKSSFVLELARGVRVRGVLTDPASTSLKQHFGELVAIEGVAQFRPSGTLLRVDVEQIGTATPVDMAAFSTEPKPMESGINARHSHRRQASTSGVNAVIGNWPGDETDEEVEALLRALS